MEPDTGMARAAEPAANAVSATPGPGRRQRAVRSARNLAAAALTLALDALLIDLVYETYAASSPARLWPFTLAACYLGATAWLVKTKAPFGRRPGWVTLPATAACVLLLAVALTAAAGGVEGGARMIGLPPGVVLGAAGAAVVALAGYVLVRPPGGAPWWWRVVAAGAAGYALAALILGLASMTPLPHLLRGGQAFWATLPFWLQGPFVGTLVLAPVALVWEIGHALARLVLKGRLAVVVALGLGVWIARLAYAAGAR